MVPTTNCVVIQNSEALAVALNVSSGCLASSAKGWMMPNDLGFCSRIKKYWCHIQSPCWPFKKHKTKIYINDALFEKGFVAEMISREKLTTPRQECCALRVPSISRLGKLHLVLWQVLGLHDLGLSKTFQKNHFDDRNYEYAWVYYPTCELSIIIQIYNEINSVD